MLNWMTTKELFLLWPLIWIFHLLGGILYIKICNNSLFYVLHTGWFKSKSVVNYDVFTIFYYLNILMKQKGVAIVLGVLTKPGKTFLSLLHHPLPPLQCTPLNKSYLVDITERKDNWCNLDLKKAFEVNLSIFLNRGLKKLWWNIT